MIYLAFLKLTNFFLAATACPLPGKDTNQFFGFPHWWEYLDGQKDALGSCVPAFAFPNDIWAVGLALIDMLLYLAGLVAVIAIIIAGIRYITAAGSAEKAATAKQMIYNAIIGLGIVLVASFAVGFIGNKLGG